MKKKLLAITLCTALSVSILTGCSNSAVENLSNTSTSATPNGPTATPAPKETTLALKETGTVGDWKFKVTKLAVKKTVSTSKYMEATASDGNLFVLASVSVTNNGKKEATFLPSSGLENTMMMAELIYKDEYQYKSVMLTGYAKDLISKRIKPLSEKSGTVTFEVPKKVAKDLKSCKIRIGTQGEAIIYPAK